MAEMPAQDILSNSWLRIAQDSCTNIFQTFCKFVPKFSQHIFSEDSLSHHSSTCFMIVDLPQLAFERILDLFSIQHNYLGYWTIPRDGQEILVRSIEIANDDPITMIIPGVSVSIARLAGIDNSRYSGTHRRKQQNIIITVDHYLNEDIDITDETVTTALSEYPGADFPEFIENFSEVIDLLTDSLVDWGELISIKKPIIAQRNTLGDFPPARAVIDCTGALYMPNSAVLL